MDEDFTGRSLDIFQWRLIEAALVNARQALTEHEEGCTAVQDFSGEIEKIDQALALFGYDTGRPASLVPLRRVR